MKTRGVPERERPVFCRGIYRAVSILGVGDGFPVPRGKMVRFRRKAMGMRDVLPRGRRNASPTISTEGRADSPGRGAGTQGFGAHLISQKSKIFDSFSSRRSQGRCRARGRIWGAGRSGGFRDGRPVPYERTGGWADSPWGGTNSGDCAATIPPSARSGRHLPLHKGGFRVRRWTGGFAGVLQSAANLKIT